MVISPWQPTSHRISKIHVYPYMAISPFCSLFPTTDLKTAAVLWACGVVALGVGLLLGMFSACFGCCCLCCISYPLAFVAGILYLLTTALFVASMCIYATQYPELINFPAVNTQGISSTSEPLFA